MKELSMAKSIIFPVCEHQELPRFHFISELDKIRGASQIDSERRTRTQKVRFLTYPTEIHHIDNKNLYMKTVILVPYLREGVVKFFVHPALVSDPLTINSSAIESRGIGLSPEPKIIV